MIRALFRALPFAAFLGASAPDPNRLEPVRPLIGGKWVGSGFLPGVGNYSSTRQFDWTLDGKFIQMQHVLTIKDSVLSEAGYFGWDAQRSAVTMWGFASDGSHTTARLISSRSGTMVIEGNTVREADIHWRILLRIRGKDELSIITEHERKGSWVPYTSAVYRRRR